MRWLLACRAYVVYIMMMFHHHCILLRDATGIRDVQGYVAVSLRFIYPMHYFYMSPT